MKNTSNRTVLYSTPSIEVFEINPDSILCQSGTYDVEGQDGIWEDPE